MNARLLLRRELHGAAVRAAQRRFGSTGRRTGGGSAEYGGWEPPHVADWHKYLGEGSMVVMFLWIFWRVKQDGAHFFVRRATAASLRPPPPCSPPALTGTRAPPPPRTAGPALPVGGAW